jgi:hypothetical protein
MGTSPNSLYKNLLALSVIKNERGSSWKKNGIQLFGDIHFAPLEISYKIKLADTKEEICVMNSGRRGKSFDLQWLNINSIQYTTLLVDSGIKAVLRSMFQKEQYC